MPTEREVERIADVLSDQENAGKTAEDVARAVLAEIESFRASAFKYNVVARYGTDYYVSYPVKTKPEAVKVARQLIADHKLDHIAILPAGDWTKSPPAGTAGWIWITNADVERMSREG